jgi:hypothetical protein
VIAKIVFLFAYLDLSLPSLGLFVPRNPLHSGSIVRLLLGVSHITRMRNFSQILKSVIRPVSVYMINLVFWKIPTDMKPY